MKDLHLVFLGFWLTSVCAQQRCGRNEVFDPCGSACEPTCANPNPQVCTLQCVAGCRCMRGYFRDRHGACVKDCNPKPPPPLPPASCFELKCPPGTHCEMVNVPCTRPPCAAPAPKCIRDPPPPPQPPRPPQCGPNEVFQTCGSACEPTCVNPNPQVCTLECVVGCRCKPGYLRDGNGACVKDCNPKPPTPLPPASCFELKCPPGTHCEMVNVPCTRPPCAAPAPKCIRDPPPQPQPPQPQICGPNEVFDLCGSACEPTCRNPNPTVCTLQCVAGCRCKKGYFRDDRGVCVKNCNPPPTPPPRPPQCGLNEVFDPCGSACEPTCRNPHPQACTLQCVPGCRCARGFFRNDNRICVKDCRTSNPPPPTPSPPQASCSDIICSPGTHCEMRAPPCLFPPCVPPRPTCISDGQPRSPRSESRGRPPHPPGPPPPHRPPHRPPRPPHRPPPPPPRPPTCANVFCPPGYRCRMVYFQCLRHPCPPPQPQCFRVPPPHLRCPANESWKECPTRCEPTCSNRSPICDKSCGRPKCQCNAGYFRDPWGRCVPPWECPR